MSNIKKLVKVGFWLALGATAGIILILASTYIYLSPNLPSVDSLRDVQLQIPLRIYTADQLLIGEFGEKRRTPIDYQQIPQSYIHAILAAEDDDFYNHHGVSIKGLLRAVSQLLLTGEKGSGGSTITMQVARNYFLSAETTYIRKFNEILLSLQIENELSKQEILELYVNYIFLGHRAYGIAAASHVYYGKPIGELDLSQLAMLAGLPKAPSTFNPIVNPARALVRRNWILGRMHKLGFINGGELKSATDSPITASFHGSRQEVDAPYIAEMVRKDMLQRYGVKTYTAGFRVYTTVDSQLQRTAQKVVVNGVLAYDLRHGYRGSEQQLATADSADQQPELIREQWLSFLNTQRAYKGLLPAVVTTLHDTAFTALLQNGDEITIEWETGIKRVGRYVSIDARSATPKQIGDIVAVGELIRIRQLDNGNWQLSQLPAVQAALVSLDANNGAIRALVGGFDYQRSKFNRITQATRQPGSNFKPFIYTAALANNFTAATTINDAAIVFDDPVLESVWRPTNDTGLFYGPTRLRKALYKSRNVVAIRLLRELGIRKAINYVGRFGFDTKKLPKDLSLALGSHSVKPLQIVSAYASIANKGFKIDPYLIDRIDGVDGDILYQATPDTVCDHCEKNSTEETVQPVVEMATIEDILEQAEVPPLNTLPPAERIIEPRVAYIIDSMLKDVVKKGTGRKARALKRDDLGGKTGTTNGPTDAWFSGYGGGVVTTAWLGFDNNGLLGSREFGSTSTLPMWIEYMREALKDRPETPTVQPPGVISVKIDPATGLLAKPGQRNAIFEYFREELAPTREADADTMTGANTYNEETVAEDLF